MSDFQNDAASESSGVLGPPVGKRLVAGRHSSLGLTFAWRIAVIFLLFGIAQFFVIHRITRGQFQSIEQTNLLDRTRQALLSLTREGKSLEGLTAANAAWGDTYAYMAKPDASYLEKAYGGNWPKIYDIDFVAMVAGDGRRIWNSDGYSSFGIRGPEIFAAERFDPSDPYVFPRGNVMKPADSFVGLMGSERGVWIYCVHPITDDNMVETPRGVLILGRLFDKASLSSYAFGQGDNLSFVPFGAVPPSPSLGDYLVGQEFPLFGGGRTTVHAEKGSLVSLTPISDSANKPLATLRLSIPSTIQRLGERFLWLTSGSLFIIAIITLIIILVAVRISVIRPIVHLAAFFNAPTEKREVILKIHAERDDEIGILAGQADALMVKVAEQRAELELQANTDRLTGLANRRCFESHVIKELRRIFRHQRGNQGKDHLAVIIIDVDHFKLYNDTYGHMAGDVCLRTLAEAVQACTHRPGDLACRFGGEEFILVLPDTDEAGAMVVSETIRAAVEGLALPHASSPVTGVVTVSVGAAAGDVIEGFDIKALTEKADQALYAAKRNGRNRVVGSSTLV